MFLLCCLKCILNGNYLCWRTRTDCVFNDKCSGSICQRSWSTLTLISGSHIVSSSSVCEGHSQTQHLTAEEGPEEPIYTERSRWEPVPKAGDACLDQAGALEGKLWLNKAEKQADNASPKSNYVCIHPCQYRLCWSTVGLKCSELKWENAAFLLLGELCRRHLRSQKLIWSWFIEGEKQKEDRAKGYFQITQRHSEQRSARPPSS